MRSHHRAGSDTSIPVERVASYRRTSARAAVRPQTKQLLLDMRELSLRSSGRDLAAKRGIALALGHGALKLAVTPVSDAADRHLKADILRETVMPALGPAGHGHVADLIEVALAHDGVAASGEGVETKQ